MNASQYLHNTVIPEMGKLLSDPSYTMQFKVVTNAQKNTTTMAIGWINHGK